MECVQGTINASFSCREDVEDLRLKGRDPDLVSTTFLGNKTGAAAAWSNQETAVRRQNSGPSASEEPDDDTVLGREQRCESNED